MTKFYTDSQKRVRPISKRRISTGTYQKGTAHLSVPKRLSHKPIRTVTQLRQSGFGVGAEVELTKPFINQFSGENIGPEVGTKGVVVGAFGSDPTIQWDKAGKYGNAKQVVDSEFLKVCGKRSMKRDILISVPMTKLEEKERKWASFTINEQGNKVSITRIEQQFDDNGFSAGDSEITLIGTKDKNGNVNFDRQKISLGEIKRSMRPMLREYYDSQSVEDMFRLGE